MWQSHGNEFFGMGFGSSLDAARCQTERSAPQHFTYLPVPEQHEQRNK
jgi:hypothetical protein